MSALAPSRIAPPSAGVTPAREALALCRTHLWYALVFSAFVNLAYLAPTLYMLQVYDRVVTSGSRPTLVFLTLALLIVLLFMTALDQVRQQILAAASVRLDRVFSRRIFRRALAEGGAGQPPRLTQSVREFDTLRAAVTGPAALAAFDAPWTPIYIVVCFILHPAIGVLALVSSLVLFALAVVNERVTRRYADRTARASASSYAAQEAAGGSMDVVRALGMGEAFATQFEAARQAASLPQLEAQYASGRISGLIRFLRLLLQSSALGLGAYLAISKQISAGAIFASSMLAARALSPIDQLVAQWRTISGAAASYRALREHMAATPEREPTALPAPAARLRLQAVTVATPARDRLQLQDINLDLVGGQVLGVLGASGAGKTTLLQVIANARGATLGELRLDGARYADWAPQRLARLIGYLPQDSVLFPGTVKDNISRFDRFAGVDEALVDAQAVKAALAAGAHELILSLPQGYDTALGARGQGLSTGQQQQLALARALYGDPLLYVLDEPNSNLDSDSEARLVRTIERLKAAGAMVVIATHRVSLINVADTLAVLKDGRLERFGSRQDILKPAPRPLRPVTPALEGEHP